MSQPSDPILIRICEGLDELGACMQLQMETLGFTEAEAVPRRAFVVASRIGGQVIGAFDTSAPGTDSRGDATSLIGFALALPGLAPGSPAGEMAIRNRPYIHSHMLGVRAAFRDRGIGRRLKLFQRQEALNRGILTMEWTFDPLEVKNAFFNISRLGAVARRYAPNLYGVSSSNPQGSLPTDRLYAEWRMDSPRVRAAVAGEPASFSPVVRTVIVPREMQHWKRSPGHRDLAMRIQSENREQFEEAFAQGMAVLGFVIDDAGNGIFQLGPWDRTLHP